RRATPLLWRGLHPYTKIAVTTGTVYIVGRGFVYALLIFCGPRVWQEWAGIPIAEWLQFGVTLAALCTAIVAAARLRPAVPVAAPHPLINRQSAQRALPALAADLAQNPAERWEAALAMPEASEAAMHRHLTELVQEFSLLYEIGQGINSIIEIDELLEVISRMVTDQLTLDEFAILLFDDRRETLRVRAAAGFPRQARVRDLVLRLGEGISGEVARTGKMVYVPDTQRDTRYLHYRGEPSIRTSFLSIPLCYKQEILGVVNFSRRGVNSFSKSAIRLLTLVANQVSLAIANAQLYTRTRELAVRDELTTIYNRRHFQHVLQLEWKRAIRFKRNLSVLMIDVDRFKSFNDTFGHLQGDRVLKQIAALLSAKLREVDTVARFGGEEFIVLLPDTDKAGAMAVGEKLRHLVEQEKFVIPPVGTDPGTVVPLTVSIGIAVYPDDVREMEDLIDHADVALYDAKDAGRNRVVCYPEVRRIGETAPTPLRRAPTRLDS
ncbi:MAG: GGDEF domain-containing protein, partial [Deltaproteobacteria bacterium]|nr:GGDEF domain-containing protein [Deltaproteobacteria bacterium]